MWAVSWLWALQYYPSPRLTHVEKPKPTFPRFYSHYRDSPGIPALSSIAGVYLRPMMPPPIINPSIFEMAALLSVPHHPSWSWYWRKNFFFFTLICRSFNFYSCRRRSSRTAISDWQVGNVRGGRELVKSMCFHHLFPCLFLHKNN